MTGNLQFPGDGLKLVPGGIVERNSILQPLDPRPMLRLAGHENLAILRNGRGALHPGGEVGDVLVEFRARTQPGRIDDDGQHVVGDDLGSRPTARTRRERTGQNLDHHRQSETLMAAQGEDGARRRRVERLRIDRRLALAVKEAVLRNRCPLVGRDANLSLGDGACRKICQKRWSAGNRNSDGDRVGGEPALGTAVRSHQDSAAAGVHEVDRDLALARGHLGPVADPAQVPRVSKAPPATCRTWCIFPRRCAWPLRP